MAVDKKEDEMRDEPKAKPYAPEWYVKLSCTAPKRLRTAAPITQQQHQQAVIKATAAAELHASEREGKW